MSADVLSAMHRADPAASMPADDCVRREETLRSILASDPAEPGLRDPAPRTRARHRATVLLVAALVVVASACATVAATRLLHPAPANFAHVPSAPPRDALLTLRQVKAEYRAWQRKLPLPPGATWNRIVVPKRQRHDFWGGNSGVMLAVDQAIGKWAAEWVAAADAHDRNRMAAAAGALTRLSEIMPVWKEGLTENQGGFDQSDVDELRAAIADGEAGGLGSISYYAYLAKEARP
jgi:hypothetical protein